MGYSGKGGIGKKGTGIENPITVEEKIVLGEEETLSKIRQIERECRVKNKTKPWPKGTTLITGSSILHGISESRLRRYQAKVRPFSGATVDDMYNYLPPLLKKRPDNIILHVGSNDSTFKGWEDITAELLNLRKFILAFLPNVKLFFSSPIIRTDNQAANSTLIVISKFFSKWFDNVITHDRKDSSCLSDGLHLNPKGSGRLATSYITLMKRL